MSKYITQKNTVRQIAVLIALILCLCSCNAPVIMPVSGPDAPTEATQESDMSATGPARVVPVSDYRTNGYFESDTGTGLVLRVEWKAIQSPRAYKVDLNLRIYLEFDRTINLPETLGNSMIINGSRMTFAVEALNDYPAECSPLLLYQHTVSVDRPDGEDIDINVEVNYLFNEAYDGYFFRTLTAQGIIRVSDKYDSLPRKSNIDVDLIRQYPELPNGCEVTSLAMALAHAGYPISKLDLKNGYLPIGDKNFYQHNIGDPASYQSYGCYSPVIAATATAFFEDREIAYTSVDLTHCTPEELYYSVSQGVPVIVWATQNLDIRPRILRTWQDGKRAIYWKGPLHCMLLTGYDLDAGTATVTDPIYGVVTHPLDTFLTRWHQMGEQAVVLLPKE